MAVRPRYLLTAGDDFEGASGSLVGRATPVGGYIWSTLSGTWQGVSNYARETGNGGMKNLTIDTARTSGRIELWIVSMTTLWNGGIVFRYQDDNNYWRVVMDGNGAIYLQRNVAGTFTTPINKSGIGVGLTGLMAVEYDASSISVYAPMASGYSRPAFVGTVTDSTFSTNTKVGLHSNSDPGNTSQGLDDFKYFIPATPKADTNQALVNEVLADTPYYFWPGDENDPGLATLTDLSGGNRPPSVSSPTNGIGPTDPIIPGTRAAFLRTQAGATYVERAYEAGADVGTGDFSLEIWLRCDNDLSNYVQFMGRDSGASGSGQLVYLNTGTGVARFYCGGGAGNGTKRLSDGVLHHLVVRRISGTAQILVDGAPDGASFAAAGSTNVTSSTRVGYIDGSYQLSKVAWGFFAYYKSGLTDARVAAHYREGVRGGVVLG